MRVSPRRVGWSERKSNEFGGKWVFAYSHGLSVTVIHGLRFFARCTRHIRHTRRTAHGMHKLPFCVNSMRMLFNHMSDSLQLPHLLHMYGVVTSYRLDRDIQTTIYISYSHTRNFVCACFFSLVGDKVTVRAAAGLLCYTMTVALANTNNVNSNFDSLPPSTSTWRGMLAHI